MLFHKYASPKVFYALSGKLIPWFAGATAILLGYGLYQVKSAKRRLKHKIKTSPLAWRAVEALRKLRR